MTKALTPKPPPAAKSPAQLRKEKTRKKKSSKAKKQPGGYTTITVAKSWCVPSRIALSGAFDPLHIWFRAPQFDTPQGVDPFTGIPTYQTADIKVKNSQAAWAEYVLLSIKTPQGIPVFQLMSDPINPKNLEYAKNRHGIPMPWDIKSGKAKFVMVEHGCKVAENHGLQDKKGRTASHPTYGGVIFTNERDKRVEQPQKRKRKIFGLF